MTEWPECGPLQKALLEIAKEKGHVTIVDVSEIYPNRYKAKSALISLRARGYLSYDGRIWKYTGE